MGVPSKRRTSSQRKRRASHFALHTKTLARCPKCKHEMAPHRACDFCGYYRGRQVVDVNKKKTKQSKKA